MSIVINVLYGNRSILMGDTRQSATDDSGFRILSDNTQKIFALSKQVAIGFTGNYLFAMALKNDCLNGKFGNIQYADELAVKLRECAIRVSNQFPLTVQFIVTGKDSTGGISSYTVQGTAGYELVEYKMNSLNEVRYAILCNTPYDNRFKTALAQAINSSTAANLDSNIRDCMADHIRYVSKRNRTVNDKPQIIRIRL